VYLDVRIVMGDWRKMDNGELHAFTKYYCDQLKEDEMCGTLEQT